VPPAGFFLLVAAPFVLQRPRSAFYRTFNGFAKGRGKADADRTSRRYMVVLPGLFWRLGRCLLGEHRVAQLIDRRSLPGAALRSLIGCMPTGLPPCSPRHNVRPTFARSIALL
jgi:hypothetical protein